VGDGEIPLTCVEVWLKMGWHSPYRMNMTDQFHSQIENFQFFRREEELDDEHKKKEELVADV
jgi:hypothetical protein